jgi:acyl carrier protein
MIEVNNSPAADADIAPIVARLKQILVGDINIAAPIEQIDADAVLDEGLKVDSVAMIELISAIETRFDILFLDSDLVTSSFANLKALAGVIAERLRAAGRTAELRRGA